MNPEWQEKAWRPVSKDENYMETRADLEKNLRGCKKISEPE